MVKTDDLTGQPLSRAAALRFVVLLGFVSLLSDVTYEGARSITGPFLAVLGASGTAVGFVAGLGELIGYGLRLLSGRLADRTGRYWAITITGYAVNLLAVPLLALEGRWEVAAAQMVTERSGKALRTPARDAMLADATGQIGHGWGFGLHEAMDQVGAVTGPLIVDAVLYRHDGYRMGFAVLLIPALLALAVLFAARWLYPRPHDLSVRRADLEAEGLPNVFWLYLAAVALIGAGFADFPLIAYHAGTVRLVPPDVIPVLYAVAMGADAAAALVFGRMFDQVSLSVLAGAALLSALFAPFAFLGERTGMVVGVVL